MACLNCFSTGPGICNVCREAMNAPLLAAMIPVAHDGEAVHETLARVTAERDALRAEVEAVRVVVEAATYVINNIDLVRETVPGEMALRDALDALRARKVGG